MSIILALSLLLFSPLAMVAIRIWRPRFALFWLTAAASALAAWLVVLLMRPSIPLNLPISFWGPKDLFPLSPALLVDTLTWPLALAVVTLHLASFFTGMATPLLQEEKYFRWKNWAGGLGIAGLTLAVIFSENILTLLLCWMLLDMVEFAIYLSHATNRQESERVVVQYAVRIAGTGLILLAVLDAFNSSSSLIFGELSARTGSILLAAAGVHMGLFPNTPVLPVNLPAHPAYGVFIRLATTAAHFALLLPVARIGALPELRGFFWIWAGLVALLSAIAWVTSKNSLRARHEWKSAAVSLAFASAAAGQPGATLAWGLAMLLPGGLALLAISSGRWKRPLQVFLALCLCSLPYTPAWHSVLLYSGDFHISWLLFLPAQALLLAGALRQVDARQIASPIQERWVEFVYTWGLLLIVVVEAYLAWLILSGNLDVAQPQPSIVQSWPAAASLFILLFAGAARRFMPRQWQERASTIEFDFSFAWVIKPLWNSYHLLRRGFLFVSSILESQSGILWTLLILLVLFSAIVQTGIGG